MNLRLKDVESEVISNAILACWRVVAIAHVIYQPFLKKNCGLSAFPPFRPNCRADHVRKNLNNKKRYQVLSKGFSLFQRGNLDCFCSLAFGDYTTQLYVNYFIRHEIRIPSLSKPLIIMKRHG